ncbi:glutamate 5-kinase [Caldanaerobius polysaccharolyticus]|uniref:glutamate 5-kinase n=1 Tax=Caldanaerobius polysaccharolyticus TaxID=44256 RepID=UPI0004787FF6|nr:glutamate 5-kinase [Caldanaerobius polysaccharolyticus]
MYSERYKKIVVKVGTSSLTHENGKLDIETIEKLVRQIADIRNAGIDISLVTSGAVGAGMTRLHLNQKPRSIPEKQAVAAVGQGILMHIYEKLFSEYGLSVAQILLTRDDLGVRKRCINFINTMSKLFEYGVIPIINENDTVAVEELRLRFGDNDTLSAMVASLIGADLLVILSDIEGLYDKDPHLHSDAKLIPIVESITDEMRSAAGESVSGYGTGGMRTKLRAARIATASGVETIIANSRKDFVLNSIAKGELVGTLFKASKRKLNTKGIWIAFSSVSNGKLIVDRGAEEAIVNWGKSLLACGIKEVEGDFNEGDTVSVYNEDGDEIARGIVKFSASEVRKIMGYTSDRIKEILGRKNCDEVIHRDNMVITC